MPNRLFDNLPFIFLLIAVPLIFFFICCVPPFQAPDEAAHFFRAAQIANGDIIGIRKNDQSSGGNIDISCVRFFDLLKTAPGAFSVDPASKKAAAHLSLAGEKVYAQFSNTVQYAPFLYAPQAAAIAIGREFDLPVLRIFYLARILNAVAALAVAFAALKLARHGRSALFFALAMPMGLFLCASLSQDALLIAGSALFLALASRTDDGGQQEKTVNAKILALMGLLAVLACGRPPCLTLGVVLLKRSFRRRGIIVLAGAGLAAALWYHLTASIAANQMPDVSSARQLAFLAAHPMAMDEILLHTLKNYGLSYLAGMFGILGLADIRLPLPFYFTAMLGLMIAVALERDRIEISSVWDRLLIAAGLTAGILATYLALYLTWTPVGAPEIDGVQGRYFIPYMMALPMVLPNRNFGRYSWAASLFVIFVPLAGAGVAIAAICRAYGILQ